MRETPVVSYAGPARPFLRFYWVREDFENDRIRTWVNGVLIQDRCVQYLGKHELRWSATFGVGPYSLTVGLAKEVDS